MDVLWASNMKQFQEGNGLPWDSNSEKDIQAVEIPIVQFFFFPLTFFSTEFPFLSFKKHGCPLGRRIGSQPSLISVKFFNKDSFGERLEEEKTNGIGFKQKKKKNALSASFVLPNEK